MPRIGISGSLLFVAYTRRKGEKGIDDDKKWTHKIEENLRNLESNEKKHVFWKVKNKKRVRIRTNDPHKLYNHLNDLLYLKFNKPFNKTSKPNPLLKLNIPIT